MKFVIIAGLVSCALAGLVGYVFSTPLAAAPSVVELDTAQEETDALRRELSALRQKVGAIERSVQQPDLACVAPLPKAPSPEPPVEQHAAEPSASVPQKGAEVWAERHGYDSYDASWAPAREKAITAAISGTPAFADIDLVDVDCRSQVCRVELTHDADESRGELFYGLAAIDEFPGQLYLHATEDGRGSILYAAREETTLPAPN